MANINLNTDLITRESLRVLHQEMNFVSNITRDYDNSFAKDGAKIGDTIRVRLPIQHYTGTGATMATGASADSIQTNTTLQLSTQRHVPMRFTSEEKTLDIDDFSSRHIRPAMKKLGAMVENDVLATALTGTANLHKAATLATPVYKDIMEARKILQEQLAPQDARTILLDPQMSVDLNDALKGLYHDSANIKRAFVEGLITRAQGFDFYENTLLPDYTSGAEDTGDAAYKLDGANQVKTISATNSDPNTMTLSLKSGTKTITNGQVFTIAGVYDVHPETKATRGALKQFTVVSGGAGGATSVTITPAIIATGPHQNVSAAGDDAAVVTFQNKDTLTTFHQSLAFQKGAFAFGTADLVLPPSEKASRANQEGVSIRLVEDFYDGVKDRLYTRLDILYGFKVIRPSLACKIWHT
jgi:hypothetical protein